MVQNHFLSGHGLPPVALAMRFRSFFSTRRTAMAPASTKYFRHMSSIPPVVRTTVAPANRIFWMRSLVMSDSLKWRDIQQTKHTVLIFITYKKLKSVFWKVLCTLHSLLNHTRVEADNSPYNLVCKELKCVCTARRRNRHAVVCLCVCAQDFRSTDLSHAYNYTHTVSVAAIEMGMNTRHCVSEIFSLTHTHTSV